MSGVAGAGGKAGGTCGGGTDTWFVAGTETGGFTDAAAGDFLLKIRQPVGADRETATTSVTKICANRLTGKKADMIKGLAIRKSNRPE
jgi:hypothetical protein